jgi:hypothetical protein
MFFTLAIEAAGSTRLSDVDCPPLSKLPIFFRKGKEAP